MRTRRGCARLIGLPFLLVGVAYIVFSEGQSEGWFNSGAGRVICELGILLVGLAVIGLVMYAVVLHATSDYNAERDKKTRRGEVKRRIGSLIIPERNKTLIHKLYKAVIWLSEASPCCFLKRRRDPEDKFFGVEEVYGLFFFSLLGVMVLVGPWIYSSYRFVRTLLLFIAGYRVYDLWVAYLNILLVNTDSSIKRDDGCLTIRHAQRWICFVFGDFLQLVFAFAVVYWVVDLWASGCTKPFNEHFYVGTGVGGIGDSALVGINALYFSLVTIVTLGYGDFQPTTPLCRLLVCGEILSGLFFAFAVFVNAVSAIRTRIDYDKKWKQKKELGGER